MKVNDNEILSGIWISVAKQLPYRATRNYFGNRRGLAPSDDGGMRYATQICTAYMSAHIETKLGRGQLLVRVKRLVDSGKLNSEKRVRGSSFWFWLPDSINIQVFDRTQELLASSGMTKEPSSAHYFASLAEKITSTLIAEFGELPEGLQ
ncbi:hypothetical protein [Pectobacterium versatile]|uniref:hypothetical protein n=1 Tax=Pectobacterium versatile TaxID=2488639 RepID=UPI0032EE0BEF